MAEPSSNGESAFEALQRFRAYSPDERLESLFLDLNAARRSVVGIEDHLRILNGTSFATSALVKSHLDMHDNCEQRSLGVRILGATVKDALLVLFGLSAGALAILEAVQRLHGG
jgi:hypothetical protein